MNGFTVTEEFAPRATHFDGVQESDGWRLKAYSVLYEGRTLDEAAFAKGEALALAALPQPAQTAQRPGIAILIRHQGRGMNYVVLCWWDRENELPMRIFVDEGNGWRPGKGSESICVWDLEIVWAERNGYISTILANPGPADDAQLARFAKASQFKA